MSQELKTPEPTNSIPLIGVPKSLVIQRVQQIISKERAGEILEGSLHFLLPDDTDEAGRMGKSRDNKAADLFNILRRRGVHILNIYPGNVNPGTEKIMTIFG